MLDIGVADLSHLDVLGVWGMDFIDQFVWVIDTTNDCLDFENQEDLDKGKDDIGKTLSLILNKGKNKSHL